MDYSPMVGDFIIVECSPGHSEEFRNKTITGYVAWSNNSNDTIILTSGCCVHIADTVIFLGPIEKLTKVERYWYGIW